MNKIKVKDKEFEIFIQSDVILKAVDACSGKQFDCVGTFNPHIGHVVRLIEKNGCLPPGALFIPPIRKLGRHHWINIWPELRIPHHFDRVSGALYRLV